jgi:hypothetical protein
LVILLEAYHAVDFVVIREVAYLIVAEAAFWAVKADESHVRASSMAE